LAKNPIRGVALGRCPVVENQHGTFREVPGKIGQPQSVRGIMACHPGGMIRKNGTILKFCGCQRKI